MKKSKDKFLKTPEDKWKQKYNIPKSTWCSKSGTYVELYSHIGLPQEIWKSSKKSNFTSNGTRKEGWMKLKVSGRKEIIKTRAEIPETETNSKSE